MTGAGIAGASSANPPYPARCARGAGALLLTEEQLGGSRDRLLTQALGAQPTWSAIPVIVIARESRRPGAAAPTAIASSVMLVERPVRMPTFLSVVQAALRARMQQYEIRDAIVQLRANQQALQEADRSKDAFLAMLAHELRNPLAPLRSGVELLRRAPPDAAAKIQAMMERQLGQLVRLVDDLLDVSRITRGQIELRRERVTLQAAVALGIEGSRPMLVAAQHAFRVDVPDAPVWLDADLSRLAQVVSNLLNNAAKYTPNGGRITLSARGEGDEAVIEVRDDGVGIAREDRAGIFRMFTQVGHTLDRSQGGLGIGLALAQSLTTMHGGTISVASEGRNLGSTFTVRLPSATAPAEERAPAGAVGVAAAAVGQRVLVVDANVDGADTLSVLLELEGHDVRVAHDGPTALAVAREFSPDLVFLDIGLPGLDGYEVARGFRGDPSLAAATLVALTGWGAEADRQRARDVGFNLHFTKPISHEQIELALAASAGR